MKIWQVSFYYPGPYCGNPDDSEESLAASDRCFAAESIIRKALDSQGLTHTHAYAWPDGSLYRFVLTQDMTKEALLDLLAQAFPDVHESGVRPDIVWPEDNIFIDHIGLEGVVDGVHSSVAWRFVLDFMRKYDFAWSTWDYELTCYREGSTEPFGGSEFVLGSKTRVDWDELEDMLEGCPPGEFADMVDGHQFGFVEKA